MQGTPVPGGVVTGLVTAGLHQASQARQDRGVDQSQRVLEFRQTRVFTEGDQFDGQFLDDLLELLGIKNAHRLREAPQGKPRYAQGLEHMRKPQRLLQHAQGVDHRIEEVEQNRRTVVAHEQAAIARLIPLASDLLKALQQRHEPLEVLESHDLRLRDRGNGCDIRVLRRILHWRGYHAKPKPPAQVKIGLRLCRTGCTLCTTMHLEDSIPDEKKRPMVHCFSGLFLKFAGNEVAQTRDECDEDLPKSLCAFTQFWAG